MLRFLRIKHLAVIDSVEVEFDPGLNVLTGETGAGKSILVEAVGLLLGGRASGDLVRTGEETATIEAIFENGGEELLVRREITAQGRSRAFINGALATAGALKELSNRLIELHGQHEHQTLLDPSTHLGVLDTFGGLDALLAPAAAAFEALRSRAGRTRADPRRGEETASTRLDLVDVPARRARSRGARGIARRSEEDLELGAATGARQRRARRAALRGELRVALRAATMRSWRRWGVSGGASPNSPRSIRSSSRTWTRATRIKSQLEDLAGFLRKYADSIDASPARLQQVEERLALLERLKRKHGPTLADVIARRDALRRELGGSVARRRTHRRARTRRSPPRARAFLAAADEAVARQRRTTAPRSRRRSRRCSRSWRWSGRASRSASPRAAAEVRMERPTASTRRSSSSRPTRAKSSVRWPASSRAVNCRAIMLAIKTLTATSRHGFSDAADRPPSASAPGLIFDEVDAGIGGRVADVVGRKLRNARLGVPGPVHHAPAADRRLRRHAFRRSRSGSTAAARGPRSAASTTAGASTKLARMLGGEAITDGLRASAREMLAGRKAGESERRKRKCASPGQGEASESAKGEERKH